MHSANRLLSFVRARAPRHPSVAWPARRMISSTSVTQQIGIPGGAQDPENSRYYVTTPIFYVNAAPHIGHLHSMVLADVLSRYHCIRNAKHPPPTLITGTDEHGMKVQRAAEAQGLQPQALCDSISVRFKDLADVAGINYKTFIRTTEPRHHLAAQALWGKLVDNGFIYKGSHAGWYAVSDETYYPESQIMNAVDEKTGKPIKVSRETGQQVEWTEEENYMFKLSAFQQPLLEWMDKNSMSIIGSQAEALIADLRATPLLDLSVSRPASRLHWGVPIPGDDSQTMYVWVDALTNYLTCAGYPQQLGPDWPADVHVVGKDIIRFHAVYWPALLMAAGLPLPRTILSHGHWTLREEKMSKSRGNVVDPFGAIAHWGADTIRYYLMRAPGQLWNDADWNPDRVDEHYRKDLSGQLGNLLGRISNPKLWAKLPDGLGHGRGLYKLPKGIVGTDREIKLHLDGLRDRFDECMQQFEVPKAIGEVVEALAKVNRHLQDKAPWHSNCSAVDTHLALFLAAEGLRISATLLLPVMPTKAAQLLDAMGVPPTARSWEHLQSGRLWAVSASSEGIKPGAGTAEAPIFPKPALPRPNPARP